MGAPLSQNPNQEHPASAANINARHYSGFPAGERTDDAIKSRSKGFVGKPYQVMTLLEIVRKVLDAA